MRNASAWRTGFARILNTYLDQRAFVTWLAVTADRTDLGFLGMACFDLYHSPDASVAVAPGAGGSAGWTWPSVAGRPGDTVYCQAVCLDLWANAFGFTISNQITIKLVN
jgi:hypothetical protein